MLNKAFNEKRRLILWLTLLLTLGFVATSLVSYFVSRNAIRHEIVTNELPLTTDNIYSEIQKDLIRTVFVSSMMAHDTFLRDWILDGETDTTKITRYLKEVQEKYGAVTSFFVSEKNRTYYHEKGVLKQVSDQDPLDAWYFRVRKLSAPYELNLDPSEAHENALSIFVNYRVTDYQGRLIGVTGIGLKVDNLRKLIDQYQIRYHRNIFLTDRQGRIVLHGSEFQPSADNIHAIPGLGKQANILLGRQEGIYQYHQDGEIFQLNARFIPELDWYLLVEKAEHEALADIGNTLFINLGICAAITIIVVLLTGMNINRHHARLKQAVETHTAELNAALSKTSAANQAKNQMLAYVSHDLRTPLANIAHCTHLLRTNPDGDIKQYQTTIEQSIGHQLELIDELMEYSQGDMEQIKLLPVPAYFYAFLQQIADQAKLLAAHQNNRFEMVLEGALPPVAVIDSKRLKQVLINLLSNASKFTSEGDIRLQVKIVPEQVGGARRLRFTVADTGSGIPEEDQQRIFLPYERSKSDRPGSGLGLAIASQIVRKMGGELKVESTSGNGSRFEFEIPLETAQEDDVLQPVPVFPIPALFGTGKRILIVEGNPAMQDYLSEILFLSDFDVVKSENMKEAENQLSASTFDAVLVTQTAPEQGAWEFLLKLHKLHHDNAPPVILYSATPLQRPDDFPEGVDFHATPLKPVLPEKLIEIMQDHVFFFSLRPQARRGSLPQLDEPHESTP